ncbi:tRNA lysidine(34) synthetase TilS [Pseudooceanicola sp. C21-150M6]|uniref:tRNA lysidine(34) synthetase TilS n=1 Tax=Pseudooceanicola sp. C21-150M6 TaxID=3434355 RepID=UPI003D7FEC5E
MTKSEGLRQALTETLGQGAGVLGVAVSGGSDSLALMVLLHDLGRELHVVTVDHGLRSEAAEEAAMVADLAAKLGHPHTTLHWTDWDGSGNLQDMARRARYALLADWGAEAGIYRIALAHTADDQAETLLMRMAREAGVDGLSAMRRSWVQNGVTFLRPAMDFRRAELQALLMRRGIEWAEDPSNADPRYDRVRMRRALEQLEPEGLTVEALSAVAANLSDARAALARYAQDAARDHVTLDRGDVLIPVAALRDLPPEIARRLVQAALGWVSGAEYPARRQPLSVILDGLENGATQPLSGCLVTVRRGILRVTREYAAVARQVAGPAKIWDRRWRLSGPAKDGLQIRATGEEGLTHCPDWRNADLPRTSLIAAPALWDDTALVSAPLAGFHNGFSARLMRDDKDFYAAFAIH